MSVSGGSTHKITAPALRRLKAQGKKITALTAYDVITSRLLDAAGVDLILVGDSVGMVFAGLESTIPVTVDEIIYHTKVVSRGCKPGTTGCRYAFYELPDLNYGCGA
jgi:3-methyl-2-oxobutanoate hydroxymethyltransferase